MTSIVTGTISWLYIVMFFHWVGDFVCQTQWMADNKSKHWGALSLHVLVYTAVVTFGGFALPSIFLFPSASSLGNALCLLETVISMMALFAVITYILHFVTDAITSRITRHFWGQKKVYQFFATIGLDQFIHLVCLIETLKFCTKL